MSTAQSRPQATQRTYPRFSIYQRIEHIVLILSFTILALTGLPQKFPLSPISIGVVNLLGGIETIRIIHRVAATVFLLEAIYHLVVVGYKLFVQRRAASMVPGVKDATDALQWFRYNLGLAKTPPKMPRYNFMEKAEYWAMLWGLLVMAVTGFMLWNPIATTRILPGEFIPAAKVAHGGEALLAVLAIILWHFYHVHIKAFNKSMFTGRMSREEMKHEHGAELEAIESGRVPVPPPPQAVRARSLIFVPAAAVVSLALLAGVYWFVTFEESAITTLPAGERADVFSPRTPTPMPTEAEAQEPAPGPTAAPEGGELGEPPAAAALGWENQIEDLFDENCSMCHGDAGGYSAETYESALAGIQPGNPDASPVVIVQASGDHPGQFRQDELGRVVEWIAAGAPEVVEQAEEPVEEPGAGEAVAWDSGVGDLFAQKCSACHGELGGYNAESYENALEGVQPGDPEGSTVVQVQADGDHPGQFTPEELDLIRQWIGAGAPETAEAGQEPGGQAGGANPLTWNGGLQEVFAAKCGACHGSLGGFSADTYNQVQTGLKAGDPDGSSIVQVQQQGGHPGMFSPEELEQVIRWIEAGAPQE